MKVPNASDTNLDKVKLGFTGLMVISLPFSESLKTLSLFVLLCIFFIQVYKKETVITWSLFHYGLVLFLCSALLSTVFAGDSAKSMKGVRDVLDLTVAFFIAQSISSEKNIKVILWGLYISTALACFFGIFHSIEIQKPLEIHSLGNQNYTAMYLVMVAVSMLSAIIFSKGESKSLKITFTMLLSLVLVAAVMTVMRSSFLGLMLFVVILSLYQKDLRSVRVFAAVMAVLILATVYFYPPMREKILMVTSLESRLFIWEYALNVFKDSPLTGIGLNNFEFTAPPLSPEAGKTLFDAHSIYMQTASQMGLPGIIALTMLIAGFVHSFTRKFLAKTDFEKMVKYSALGGFLVTFFSGVLDTTLHHEHGVLCMFLMGLMFGVYHSRSGPLKTL